MTCIVVDFVNYLKTTNFEAPINSPFSTLIGYHTTESEKFAMLFHDESNYFSTRFWYDKLGRLILSQNAKQYPNNAFSYTLYDEQGRILESGEKEENTTLLFHTIFGSKINGYLNSLAIDQTKFMDWINGNGERREVVKTFYDEPQYSFDQENLRKRVASIIYQSVYGDNTNYQSASHYSYDIHGNVKTLWQENKDVQIEAQQVKRLDYDYDLVSGKVNKVSYQAGAPDQFFHRYAYDADNRLLKAETSRDNLVWDLDAKYFYYAHGPLARVEYGDLKVQGLDYAYTLQGWLKGVNSNMLKADFDMGQDGYIPGAGTNPNAGIARDAMGFTLSYFNGDYQAIGSALNFEASLTGSELAGSRHDLYNGNISSMVTNLPENNTIIPKEFRFAKSNP